MKKLNLLGCRGQIIKIGINNKIKGNNVINSKINIRYKFYKQRYKYIWENKKMGN